MGRLLLLPDCFSIDEPELLPLDAAAPAVGRCLDSTMVTMIGGRLLELFGDGVAVLRSPTLQVGRQGGREGGGKRDTVWGRFRCPTLQAGGRKEGSISIPRLYPVLLLQTQHVVLPILALKVHGAAPLFLDRCSLHPPPPSCIVMPPPGSSGQDLIALPPSLPPSLQAQYLTLPLPAVLALLGSDQLIVDCENTVAVGARGGDAL